MDNIRLEDIKKDLVKLANHLDGIKKTKEADFVDRILNKLAQDMPVSQVMPGDLPFGRDLSSWTFVLKALKEALEQAGIDEEMRNRLVTCLGANPMVMDEIPKNLLKEFLRCAEESGMADELLEMAQEAVEKLIESVAVELRERTPELKESLEDLKEGFGDTAETAVETLKDLMP